MLRVSEVVRAIFRLCAMVCARYLHWRATGGGRMRGHQPSAASGDKWTDLPVSAGDVLDGKYRIEEILGRGGMGAVVAATHLALDQPVALKVLLRKATQSSETVARFAREARTAAKIQS